MRKFLWVAIMAAAVVNMPDYGFAQRGDVRGSSRGNARGSTRGNSGFNYQDISQRNTQRTEREARQKKEAEEAKKKAEEERKKKEREDRMKRWRDSRGDRDDDKKSSKESAGKATQIGKSADRKKPGEPASAPVTTGGSYDPTTRQVTEVMLDAVKTQEVKFSRVEAADDPSIILLNEPRHNPEERKRAADFGIGKPL